jgi:hypothetical protein
MCDDSRKFVELPETVFFDVLRDYAAKLKGTRITDFITDWVTEVWLDFEYRGHEFSVNDKFGDYWFFVEDPNCPDEILHEVAKHFRRLLEK